jgi:hypothetical protein
MLSAEQISDAFAKIAGVSTELRLYALIDHSGMPGLVNQLTRTSQAWVSLFQGSNQENAITVAPILVALDVQTVGRTGNQALDWIGERSPYSSSLLLLASPLGMDELARRLTARLDAKLPDNMNVMLRYFDTRIFAELMGVLDDSQKGDFLSPASQWWYVDRRGMLQTVAAALAPQDAFVAPLTLNSAQQNALIDASEPDQIAELLQDAVPDEYGQLPYQDRFDFIVRHAQTAQGFGIMATHEKSFYCTLALMYGEDFASQPAWRNGLTEIRSGTLTLQKLTQQIEEKDE